MELYKSLGRVQGDIGNNRISNVAWWCSGNSNKKANWCRSDPDSCPLPASLYNASRNHHTQYHFSWTRFHRCSIAISNLCICGPMTDRQVFVSKSASAHPNRLDPSLHSRSVSCALHSIRFNLSLRRSPTVIMSTPLRFDSSPPLCSLWLLHLYRHPPPPTVCHHRMIQGEKPFLHPSRCDGVIVIDRASSEPNSQWDVMRIRRMRRMCVSILPNRMRRVLNFRSSAWWRRWIRRRRTPVIMPMSHRVP